jgi:hypothetical protein
MGSERGAHVLDRRLRRDGGQHGVVVEDRELTHGRAHDTVRPVNRRPRLTLHGSAASPEEAAAVVAAIEQFLRETAPPRARAPQRPSPWVRAARREAVGAAEEPLVPWVPAGGTGVW